MERPLYICDIDGTVANLVHRLHYIDRTPPDWNSFYEACSDDEPIPNIIKIIRMLLAQDAEIWLFTGRMDSGLVKEKTLDWLSKHVTHGHLSVAGLQNRVVMRPLDDYRADDIIKLEMLNNMLLCDRNRLVAVFDDRQRVVDMWRANGLICMQVAPGDF